MAAILLASTVIDVRATYCFFLNECQLHGPLHTYLGATVFAMAMIIVIYASKTISKSYQIN